LFKKYLKAGLDDLMRQLMKDLYPILRKLFQGLNSIFIIQQVKKAIAKLIEGLVKKPFKDGLDEVKKAFRKIIGEGTTALEGSS
jgi:hypothetical protein